MECKNTSIYSKYPDAGAHLALHPKVALSSPCAGLDPTLFCKINSISERQRDAATADVYKNKGQQDLRTSLDELAHHSDLPTVAPRCSQTDDGF